MSDVHCSNKNYKSLNTGRRSDDDDVITYGIDGVINKNRSCQDIRNFLQQKKNEFRIFLNKMIS